MAQFQHSSAAAGGGTAEPSSLSSSLKAGRRLRKSLVDYTMSIGRDALDPNVLKHLPRSSDDGQPIGERIEPFFDDVPGMLADIDDTMYRARLYHDAVAHSDAEAAQYPAQVWSTVGRPSPVYISDRIDVEKEFLTTRPRATKVSRYVAAPSQQQGFSPTTSQSVADKPARHAVRPSPWAGRTSTVHQPDRLTLRSRGKQGDGSKEGAQMHAPHEPFVKDDIGLSMHALERRQHESNRFAGNHVSIGDSTTPDVFPQRQRRRPMTAQTRTAVQQAPVTGRPATAVPVSKARGSPSQSPSPSPKTAKKQADVEAASVAKYDKLIRTMQEMGDFKELADMADGATSDTSVMESWVSDWKGKAEQLLAHEPSMVSDLAAEDSSQTARPESNQIGKSQPRASGAGHDKRHDSRSSTANEGVGSPISPGLEPIASQPAILEDAEHMDEQTRSLVDFNEAFRHLMTFTEESEKARREYESNNISLFKAARIARKHAQYPLQMVEQYVEASKTGMQGQEQLHRILAHVRRQWQVVAQAAGIQSGLSGTSLYKDVENDLNVEILGGLKGDLGNLTKHVGSALNGNVPDEGHSNRDGGDDNDTAFPQAQGSAASPSRSTPPLQAGSAMDNLRARSSGGKESAENARLLSWLERITDKQRKRNDVRSTDVSTIEDKFRRSGYGLHSVLNPGVAAATTIQDYDPETVSELAYFLLATVKDIGRRGNADLVSMMGMAFQCLLSEVQWLVAMIRSTQGGNSPHIKVIDSLVKAIQAEQLMRRAAEEHVRGLGEEHEAMAIRVKQLSGRGEDLLDKLAKKEKALIEVKGSLGEASEEARALRERVRILEGEVKLLEGNMSFADSRAAATGQVVKHGLKFQGTLRTANLVCKWNGLSKEIQATGNGRADDPRAIVEDIVVPQEKETTPPPSPKPKVSRQAAKAKSSAQSFRKKKP